MSPGWGVRRGIRSSSGMTRCRWRWPARSRGRRWRRLGVNETTLRNWVLNDLAEEARSASPLALSPSEFEKLRRLRREVEEFRVEKEILRKGSGLFRPGDDPVCRFRSVADHRHAYGVKRLCRVLAVSRSGFYAFLNRPRSPRQVADTDFAKTITGIYQRSRCTYGAPRVHAELARRGVCAAASGSPDWCGPPPGRRARPTPLAHRPLRRCGRRTRSGTPQLQPDRPESALGRRGHPVPDRGGLALPRRRAEQTSPTRQQQPRPRSTSPSGSTPKTDAGTLGKSDTA